MRAEEEREALRKAKGLANKAHLITQVISQKKIKKIKADRLIAGPLFY